MANINKQTIGRVVSMTIPEAEVFDLPSKVDTGAYRSSIWATNINESNGILSFVLLDPESKYYSGKTVSTTEYKEVQVENSFGQRERRYSVKLTVEIAGRKVKATFTLANRSLKSYPALIGRRTLNNRFLIDVSTGGPLIKSRWR
jgi:hypothetical protein